MKNQLKNVFQNKFKEIGIFTTTTTTKLINFQIYYLIFFSSEEKQKKYQQEKQELLDAELNKKLEADREKQAALEAIAAQNR